MKIKTMKYRGFKYDIMFADKGDWGKNLHTFFAQSNSGFYGEHHKSMDDTVASIESCIDKFLETIPKTEEEWVAAITDCVVRDGYEDWHIDHNKTMHVLKLYAKSRGV